MLGRLQSVNREITLSFRRHSPPKHFKHLCAPVIPIETRVEFTSTGDSKRCIAIQIGENFTDTSCILIAAGAQRKQITVFTYTNQVWKAASVGSKDWESESVSLA